MLLGKKVRLERISDRNTKKTVIVPLTHGVGMGPIEGIMDIQNTIDVVSLAGANAIVLNKGVVPRAHRGRGRDIGLILHLTGGLDQSPKVQVCTVEEALRIGADAVRCRLVIGGSNNGRMLETLGAITRVAMDWGMPLLMTVTPAQDNGEDFLDLISHGARIAAELGADIISIPYPGSTDALESVIETTPAPIIVAGGEKVRNPIEILKIVHDSIAAGSYGVSVGRNVFQYEKPGNMVKAISKIVHDGVSVSAAANLLTEAPLTSAVFSPPLW